MRVIEENMPSWRTGIIHKSSPADRGANTKLANEYPHYIPSQYFPNFSPGKLYAGIRFKNLEALSFTDDSLDLHVTQDVLEYVFDPRKVFQEIARTLKPGGMHIFSVPIVREFDHFPITKFRRASETTRSLVVVNTRPEC
jgi:SAM-dependent methyltransferase